LRCVDNPLFTPSLFRIRAFTWGNVANLCVSLGRGGLQFILIIWLQRIWLPQHGYGFERTPLWAGIYMPPMTVSCSPRRPPVCFPAGSAVACSRRAGRAITALTFGLLIAIPVDFNYWAFAAILLLNGIGMGMFSSPNRAEVMNSLPGDARGSGSGMMTTFQNSAMVHSIGFFVSLIIAGLSSSLLGTMSKGLVEHGVSAASAGQIARLPAVAVLIVPSSATALFSNYSAVS
jgi:hypothetical protein